MLKTCEIVRLWRDDVKYCMNILNRCYISISCKIVYFMLVQFFLIILYRVYTQSEVPHVSSAFKMSGYTPSQVSALMCLCGEEALG